jgi:isoamylase
MGRRRHDVRRARQRAVRPLAAVVDTAFTWGDDRPPRTPWHETLIYELHVKGFTKLHPARARAPARHVPRAGERAGDPAPHVARRHGRRADAGAPSHRRVAPGAAGLRNYWGYNTLSYFAPDICATRRRRRRSRAVREFKMMVRALHAAGLEVILDVVYNHTAKATTSGRRCRCAGSTTRRTTGCSPTTRATTRTSPGAATR